VFRILEKREMAERTVCEFKIEAPDIARKAKPGQFVVIRANETGERIPLTMAGADPEAGTINIIFQVVGKTTALLRSFGEDDEILDIIGPLGVPTHVEKLWPSCTPSPRRTRKPAITSSPSLVPGRRTC
jgi:ferredoxin--NADP+ reductase